MLSQLKAEIVPRKSLSVSQQEAMFHIFQRHYEHISWEQYERDLHGKDYVILLLERQNEKIQGFSTQQIFSIPLSGKTYRILFSGDTVIDQKFWGEQELVRSWCFFAGQILAQEPSVPLYWYLLSKGYRTYLYLPLFFRTFYPKIQTPIPSEIQSIRDQVSFIKYPKAYCAKRGILSFEYSQGNLTPELAQIPEEKKKHPHIAFFLEKNPDYALGTELVCIAEISIENMRSFAQKYVEKGCSTLLDLTS